MRKFFLGLIFFSFLCINFNVFSFEEIEIELETKGVFYPIYVSDVTCSGTDYSLSYLNDIKDVLLSDLKMSAYFNVLKKDKPKELLISYADKKTCFDDEFWKEQKVYFVIKLTSSEKKLNFFVFDVMKNKSTFFSSMEITGSINHDRKKVHRFVDAFIEEYLGKKGIASSKILYTARKKVGSSFSSELWQCDSDGYNSHRLISHDAYCVTPVVLRSEGDEIKDFMFVSYRNGTPKILKYVNENLSEVVTLRGNQLLPSISKQGDKIAFISDAAGRPDLFLYNLYGKGKNRPIQLYSAPRATQASSSFSPDGKSIAFVSDKDGSPRIYLIKIPENVNNLKRPYAHLITKENRYNVTPCFSPDGTKLAYSAKVDGARQIWVYDFETKEEMQITRGKENKENPSFALDNMHIIYNTEENNSSELYIVDLILKKPMKIKTSSGKGQKRFPVWGK